MITVRRLADLDDAARAGLLDRGRLGDTAVADRVRELVAAVRAGGDAALRAQAARFDGVELDALEVPRGAWVQSSPSAPGWRIQADPGARSEGARPRHTAPAAAIGCSVRG